jgi:hypothetical protein
MRCLLTRAFSTIEYFSRYWRAFAKLDSICFEAQSRSGEVEIIRSDTAYECGDRNPRAKSVCGEGELHARRRVCFAQLEN